MILPARYNKDGLNKFGEVNWTRDEMSILADSEALELMDAHQCSSI